MFYEFRKLAQLPNISVESHIKNWLVSSPQNRKQHIFIDPPELAMGIESDTVICIADKICPLCSKNGNDLAPMSMMRAIRKLIVIQIDTKCRKCMGLRTISYFNDITNNLLNVRFVNRKYGPGIICKKMKSFYQ